MQRGGLRGFLSESPALQTRERGSSAGAPPCHSSLGHVPLGRSVVPERSLLEALPQAPVQGRLVGLRFPRALSLTRHQSQSPIWQLLAPPSTSCLCSGVSESTRVLVLYGVKQGFWGRNVRPRSLLCVSHRVTVRCCLHGALACVPWLPGGPPPAGWGLGAFRPVKLLPSVRPSNVFMPLTHSEPLFHLFCPK